jgi:hypothetical protein
MNDGSISTSPAEASSLVQRNSALLCNVVARRGFLLIGKGGENDR